MKKELIRSLFLFVLIGSVSAASDVHVTDAGNSWFTIKFNSSVEGSSGINYGSNFNNLGSHVSFNAVGGENTINLTGLQADTLYYYDIVERGVVDNNFGRHYRFVTNIGSGRTYFMSNSGSDSNPGTYNEPWKTLNYAKEQLSAGDTLLIMDGVYTGFGENIGITLSSGSPGNPISYKAYNKGYGIKPVFDGEFLDNVYPDYYRYILHAGTSAVNANDILIDSLWVRNLEDGGDESAGIILRYSNNILIRDCYASEIQAYDSITLGGGFMVGGSTNVEIDGCKVWENLGTNEPNHGSVNIYSTSGRSNNNISVKMCEFWDSDAGIAVKSGAQADIILKENFIHNVLASGIHDSGGNSLLEKNIIYNSLVGIDSYLNYDNDLRPNPQIIQNTVANCTRCLQLINTKNGARVNILEKNILYTEVPFLRSQHYAVMMSWYYGNNDVEDLPAEFLESDYNLFYHLSKDYILEYPGLSSATEYKQNLENYRLAYPDLEQHSLQTDPMLRDISNRDFRLAEGSPARTASETGNYIGAIDPNERIGRIEIHPLEIDLNENEEYLFVVKIFDESEEEIPPGHFPVEWSCVNGTIDENGVYVASADSDVISVDVDGLTYQAFVGSQPNQSLPQPPINNETNQTTYATPHIQDYITLQEMIGSIENYKRGLTPIEQVVANIKKFIWG